MSAGVVAETPVGPPPGPPERRRGRWWIVFGSLSFVLGVAAVAVGLLTTSDVAVAASRPPAQVAATPVLSLRRAPEWASRPVASRNLAAAVNPVVAALPANSCVEVRDGANQIVASKDTTSLLPASNLKLLTASAAMDILGPDTKLTTSFASTAPVQGGVITGDLYVIGGGDPLLTGDTYAATFKHGPQPATDIETVADQLKATGITHITGSLVGDDSRYDNQRTVPSWKPGYLPEREVSPLSALTVNDGSTMDPLTGGPDTPAADPSLQAATTFTRLLQARGIQVDGAPRTAKAPAQTTKVLDVASQPVKVLVGEMLQFSDNTTAEMLLKEMGLAKGGVGSTTAGLAAERAWLTGAGVDLTGVTVVDGSGLSRDDRVSCHFFGDLLSRGGPQSPLAQSLAVPGKPGTLDKRFTSADLGSHVRAKTGTLTAVTALSGWVATDPGRNLTFSLLINTDGRAVDAADFAAQNNLLEALLPYPQTPPIAQISPLGPIAPAG